MPLLLPGMTSSTICVRVTSFQTRRCAAAHQIRRALSRIILCPRWWGSRLHIGWGYQILPPALHACINAPWNCAAGIHAEVCTARSWIQVSRPATHPAAHVLLRGEDSKGMPGSKGSLRSEKTRAGQHHPACHAGSYQRGSHHCPCFISCRAKSVRWSTPAPSPRPRSWC